MANLLWSGGGVSVASHLTEAALLVKGAFVVNNILSPHVDYVLCKGDLASLKTEVCGSVSGSCNRDLTDVFSSLRRYLSSITPFRFSPERFENVIPLKDPKSSPGMPLRNRYANSEQLMEEFSLSELVQTMQSVEAAICEGEDVLSLFYCFSKRDKYAPSKVLNDRFRSIQCGDVFLLWLAQRWFGSLVEFLEDNVPQFFLVTTEDQYNRKVGARLRSGFSFGVDFSAYDKTETGDLLDSSVSLLCEYTTMPRRLRDFFVRTCCAPMLLLPDGEIVLPGGSNPSGQFLTSILNSLNHLVYNACMYHDLLDVPFMEYFQDQASVRSVMTGDDGIETFQDEAQALDVMESVGPYLAQCFGVKAKVDAVRDGDVQRPYPKGVLPPYLSTVEVAVPGAYIRVPFRFNRLLPTIQYATQHDLKNPALPELTRERVVGIYDVASGFDVAAHLRAGYQPPQAFHDFKEFAKQCGVTLPSLRHGVDIAVSLADEQYVEHSRRKELEKVVSSSEKTMPRKPRRKVRTLSKSSAGSRRNSSSGRRATTTTSQSLAAPMPKVHQRILGTMQTEGTDREHASPEALRINQLVVSMADKFNVSVIQSVLVPSHPFPLPGINLFGISNRLSLGDTSGAMPSGLDAMPWTGGVFPLTEMRGTTMHNAANEGTVAVARYSRFSGKAATTVELTTGATGMLEVWIFADPTALDFPVNVIEVAAPVAGNYTDLTVAQRLDWQANPYPFAQAFTNEFGNTPCTEWESNSLYYEGGAALFVSTLNANAFLSTAYQVRTGDNIPDRFLDSLPDLWTVAEPAAPLGFSDTPITCQGALSLYTGAGWHVGTRSHGGGADPANDLRFHVSGAFRRCWALGAPFVRVIVRTQSNGIPAPGPCQFNVRFNCWAATAPSAVALAAAQPFETVPYESPSWLKSVKTRGTTFDSDKSAAYGELMRSIVQKIPEGMAGATPLERALIQQPTRVVKAIASTPVAERPAQDSWFEKAIGFAQRAANTVERVANVVAPVGALIAKLL